MSSKKMPMRLGLMGFCLEGSMVRVAFMGDVGNVGFLGSSCMRSADKRPSAACCLKCCSIAAQSIREISKLLPSQSLPPTVAVSRIHASSLISLARSGVKSRKFGVADVHRLPWGDL